MAAKSIVADLNKGDKLNGDNYDIWHKKVQFLLEEQEVIEAIRNVMVEPSGEGPAQQVTLKYLSTHEMLADLMSKPIPRDVLSDT
ncbi:UBN2_3 domain-containing protein [Senna tora]|uniref:UBN2_3 domain-containing protein n=1 Tax=Senna tora TaxID=362788 RepID=A0A834WIE5_9FABA|nr:UBN2_3 domain-containing protein [Senna tora]